MTTAPDGAEHLAPTDEDVVILEPGTETPTDTTAQQPARKRHFSELEPGDEEYGFKVQKRVNQAIRERNTARTELQRAQDANAALQRQMAELRRTTLDVTEQSVARSYDDAKARHKRSFDDADGDGMAAAAAEMAELTAHKRELEQSRQRLEAEPKPTEPKPQQQYTPQTQAYIDENPWFNDDDLARNAALNAHALAGRRGIKPDTPEYFDLITKSVKAQFPEHFEDLVEVEQEAPPARQAAPVAPVAAARRTPPGTTQQPTNRLPSLTRQEADLAIQMGMTHREYAIEKMKIAQAERKN